MSAPGNSCNVQRFKLLICLAMESHIKVTDLISVKIKKTLKSFQSKVHNCFRYHKLISQRTHDTFLVCITLPVSHQFNETRRNTSLSAKVAPPLRKL